MAHENATVGPEAEATGRRDFVKNSAAVAVTAPAVALLLSASTSPAVAQPYVNNVPGLLDDFTFGNDAEDIDAIKTGTNFTAFGMPAIDDHNVL